MFANDKKQVRLVITGVGKMNAAVAVAELSTIDPPAKADLMVNYGSCAAERPFISGKNELAGGESVSSGSIVMVNKLTDVESGRTFYPDMIYRHPFAEGEVETSVYVYAAGTGASDETPMKAEVAGHNVYDEGAMKAEVAGLPVYDMEAAAFYEAGNFFYGPHQMMFIKVVTDYGISANMTMPQDEQKVCGDHAVTEPERGAGQHGMDKERFVKIMQTAGTQVADFLDGLLTMMRQDEAGEAQGHEERLAEDLHCSVTMRAELTQLLTYWRLAGFDAGKVIDGYYDQGILPCKDKREGRRLLDELHNKWL